MRHHTTSPNFLDPHFLHESGHGMKRSSGLERPYLLEVLALEPYTEPRCRFGIAARGS